MLKRAFALSDQGAKDLAKDLLTKVKQKFQICGSGKKATQNQAAEHLKIETAASQMV